MERRRPSLGTIPARAGVPAGPGAYPGRSNRVVLDSRMFHMEFPCRYASVVVGASCSRGESSRQSGDVMRRPTRPLPAEPDGDAQSASITTSTGTVSILAFRRTISLG